MAKGKYKVVTLAQLIEKAKDSPKAGSPRVVAALETIDKPIVATVERKGETYFILEG